MKKLIEALTLAATIAMMATACNNDGNMDQQNSRTPVGLKNLAVAESPAITDATRTGENSAYDAFNEGDRLVITIAAASGSKRTATYWYRADRIWEPHPAAGETLLYKEDIDAQADEFTAHKGESTLMTRQITLADYRMADYITGRLILMPGDADLATPPNEPMQHRHVNVVINITTNGAQGWENVDFMEHILAADVTLGTVAPWRAMLTPNAVTYCAVMPLANVPAPGQALITITAAGRKPITGTYTLAPGQTLEAGNRLTVNLTYDNHHLANAEATITPWTAGGNYTAAHQAYDMLIASADDLVTFANLVNSGHPNINVLQTADIDLSGIDNWTPIGINRDTPFAGLYNGGGKTISGLKTIDGKGDYYGLFGYVSSNAMLVNTHLRNVDIKGHGNVGGLVGYSTGHSIAIIWCSVEGTLAGSGNIGGLVGTNYARITACRTYVDITGHATEMTVAGGMAGSNNTIIELSHAGGSINNPSTSPDSKTGGFTGRESNILRSSYSTVNVTALSNVKGALVGMATGTANIEYCYGLVSIGAQYLIGSPSGNGGDTNSGKSGQAGNTVRGYTGGMTLKTGLNERQLFNASNWGPGNLPQLRRATN